VNLSLLNPGTSEAMSDIKAMRYIWSAMDSAPFIPWLTHPFLFVVYTIQYTFSSIQWWISVFVERAYLESVAESEKIDSRRGGGGGGFMFLGLGTNQNEWSVVAENNKGFCYNVNRPPMMMMMMQWWHTIPTACVIINRHLLSFSF